MSNTKKTTHYSDLSETVNCYLSECNVTPEDMLLALDEIKKEVSARIKSEHYYSYLLERRCGLRGCENERSSGQMFCPYHLQLGAEEIDLEKPLRTREEANELSEKRQKINLESYYPGWDAWKKENP